MRLRPVGVPAELRSLAPDRVLAWAATGEEYAAGTRSAFLLTPATVLGWEQVDQASWDRDASLLTVRSGATTLELPIDDPRDLLELVRERVTASLVLQRRVEITDRKGVLVAARRPPLGGDLVWRATYDPGLDPDDPAVRQRVQDTFEAARHEIDGI